MICRKCGAPCIPGEGLCARHRREWREELERARVAQVHEERRERRGYRLPARYGEAVGAMIGGRR
ncbi:MAG: hypothetical protein ABFE07_28400 [Armatimonadia bacterium]